MSDAHDDLVDDDDDPDLNDDPDDNSVIRKLRKDARDGKAAVRENATLKAENATLKNEKLMRQAGLDSLSEKKQRAILGDIEGEVTVDALKASAIDLGYLEAKEEDDDDEAQQQMADAAATTNAGQHKAQDTMTAADFAKLDMKAKKDFIQRNPEKFEALKRGESVKLSG